MLYLGDVYERGTPEEFRERMAGPYGPLLRRMLPTPGNHEWPRHPEGYDAFWAGVTGAPTPPWYAVRLGGWEVLSLNSEAAHDPGSPQLRWLRRRLRAAGTCRLAVWHRPRFSVGRHGDQEDVEPLWSALAGHAALVLNGHDHDLQRLRPRDGLVELVGGAGGNGRYGVHPDRRVAFADDDHDGAIRVELRRGVARVQAVAAGGAVLDRTTVRCRPVQAPIRS